jgi:sirohydrochlorin cobaltochelatase
MNGRLRRKPVNVKIYITVQRKSYCIVTVFGKFGGMSMKTAVLVSSYGTDCVDARERSLDRIYYDLREAAGKDKNVIFYQSYTSEMLLKTLSDNGMKIHSTREAVEKAIEEKARRLIVIPTLIAAGTEYKRLCDQVMEYRDSFKQIKITRPLLEDEWDCVRQTSIFSREFKVNPDKEYILVGRGSDSAANQRYFQMNRSFKNSGLGNVRIATMGEKPNIDDVLNELKKKENKKTIVLHPFMVASGENVKKNIAGETDSFASRLKEAGYEVEVILKGLGEYPEFRNVYVNRLRAIL